MLIIRERQTGQNMKFIYLQHFTKHVLKASGKSVKRLRRKINGNMEKTECLDARNWLPCYMKIWQLFFLDANVTAALLFVSFF